MKNNTDRSQRKPLINPEGKLKTALMRALKKGVAEASPDIMTQEELARFK
jgi:hypothetical protein